MWALFTKALARGTSTTQVSIINTSSNFMITAILGFIIFSESLPPLWWLGAALLVAGNVIIGRREEAEVVTSVGGIERAERAECEVYGDEEVDGLLAPEAFQLDEDVDPSRKVNDDDDALELSFDEDGRREDDLI